MGKTMCKFKSNDDFKAAKEAALGAKYICKSCYRSAVKDKNLCKPVKIEK